MVQFHYTPPNAYLFIIFIYQPLVEDTKVSSFLLCRIYMSYLYTTKNFSLTCSK